MRNTPPRPPMPWLPCAQALVLMASLLLVFMPAARETWLQPGHLLLYLWTSGTVIARDYKAGWLTQTPAQILARIRAGVVPPRWSALESVSIIVGAVAITLVAAA